MDNQTLQNIDNNRDENQKNEAEFMLHSLWLGRRDSNPSAPAKSFDTNKRSWYHLLHVQ